MLRSSADRGRETSGGLGRHAARPVSTGKALLFEMLAIGYSGATDLHINSYLHLQKSSEVKDLRYSALLIHK